MTTADRTYAQALALFRRLGEAPARFSAAYVPPAFAPSNPSIRGA